LFCCLFQLGLSVVPIPCFLYGGLRHIILPRGAVLPLIFRYFCAMKIELYIEGMHCEKCAARLQKALSNKDGVRSAGVSFPDSKAVVDFDERLLTADGLKTVVEDCGFSVVKH